MTTVRRRGPDADGDRDLPAEQQLLGDWLASGDFYRAGHAEAARCWTRWCWCGPAAGTDLASLRTDLESATDPFLVVKVQDREQFKGSQANQINGLLGVLYGLLALAIVIAILGIINTLALSVVERRREIGMLRAVGMQRAAGAPHDLPGVDADRGLRRDRRGGARARRSARCSCTPCATGA